MPMGADCRDKPGIRYWNTNILVDQRNDFF